MNDSLELEVVDLESKRERREIAEFLASFGLGFEEELDYTVALLDHGSLVGTGSFKGEVLRNFAVSPAYQGQGLTATLVTALMREAARRGLVHYFVFTKPESAHLFAELGFAEIASFRPQVTLLETGLGSITTWLQNLKTQLATRPGPWGKPRPGSRAAVVINGNPFTKGHEALIRQAASENESVIVFVVSEDRSVFPFEARFRLTQAALKDLTNVAIWPSGQYLISEATFPNYFLKKGDDVLAQTGLDVTIFAKIIAPALDIATRYVGEEPYCPVTQAYNETMAEILPKYGLKLKVIKRIAVNNQAISATTVREAWRAKDWTALAALVPLPTLEYLQSHESPEIEQSENPNQI